MIEHYIRMATATITTTGYTSIVGGLIALPEEIFTQALNLRLVGVAQPAANTSCELRLRLLQPDGQVTPVPRCDVRIENKAAALYRAFESPRVSLAEFKSRTMPLMCWIAGRVTSGSTSVLSLAIVLSSG